MKDISFKSVLDWFENYYDFVVSDRKRIHGYLIESIRIEIQSESYITLIHEILTEGENKKEKINNFMQNIFDDNQIILEFKMKDFLSVVNGEKTILESDYSWSKNT